jgi:DNA-nicking Smr family endonuclease
VGTRENRGDGRLAAAQIELRRRPVKPKSTGKNPSARAPRGDDVSDADAFERAMMDVVRLRPDDRGRIRDTPPVEAPLTPPSARDQIDEPEDDFAAHGVDRREIRKLKRLQYAVGDRRDLHGMTVAEACASVTRFIENSRHARRRCVCIVHGRGLHSEGQLSVLKARVRECLRRHRSVLAYAARRRRTADQAPCTCCCADSRHSRARPARCAILYRRHTREAVGLH